MGLTSLVVAGLFALSLFFWPLFVVVSPQATALALMLVGILMFQCVARIDMGDLANAVPVSMTLLVTVLINNLIDGVALGTLSTVVVALG